MLTSELRTKLYEYRELRAKIAELKEAMEQVEDALTNFREVTASFIYKAI